MQPDGKFLFIDILKIAYFNRFVNHIPEFEHIFMTNNFIAARLAPFVDGFVRILYADYVENVTYLLKM